MSPHPLVLQLRFARSELVRCLEGVTPEDAVRRVQPMNCISWVVGHLANQENAYWNILAGRGNPAPGLNDLVGFGKPASTPPMMSQLVPPRRAGRSAKVAAMRTSAPRSRGCASSVYQ